MRYLLPLLLLLFFYACLNPAKLLEQGKYTRALDVSSWQLRQGRIKASELATLETSFYRISQRDSQEVADLRNSQRPEVWPKIYQKALQIDDRQNKVRTLQTELEQADYYPRLDYYPAQALVKEAAEKSALYHYANAQEHIPSARNGDRHAARQAYVELDKSLKYVEGFRDADDRQIEMRELGTIHLLLQFGGDNSSLVNRLRWGHSFPIRENWIMIHESAASAPKIHFEMEAYLTNFYVSANQESCSTCTNSVEVEDGFIIKKVWSQKDSAYVDVKEQQYKTVSATVTTITQTKEASALLQVVLYDALNGQAIDEYGLSGSESWSNEYSSYSGDSRALTLMCPSVSGMCAIFPMDISLLDDAVDDLRWQFWNRIQQVENY